MASCLGLYIENNLIKYAKVSKEKDNIKVESFGTKFYDNIETAIKQIIEETYSYKTPISINTSEEIYNYFDMFALLNKKDLEKAIKMEFETYCGEKNYNPNVFETRYAIVPNPEQNDKLKVIHVSENKIELNKKIQQFNAYKLFNISPISMSIFNIANLEPRENSLIINIEEKTTITTIIEQKIYDVKILDKGSRDFLDRINIKENSYAKSYELCKNTTIYTSEGKELTEGDTNYLEDIMPTLYEIVGNVRKTINENVEKISKVYITGTAALINNIDLYFEEYLEEIKCEILKPKFVKPTPDINLKDYLEVNSAISLALTALGEGITGMNFKKLSFSEKLPDFFKLDLSPEKDPTEKKYTGNLLTMDFGQPLDQTEKGLVRIAVSLLILLVLYSTFSILLKNQMDKKTQETNDFISNTKTQISSANADNEKMKTKISEYTTKINNLEEVNEKLTNKNKTKKAIPNLLNQLMYVMPEEVQLTSITNTTDTHIEIQAQSTKYEQLGYLKASIQTEVILTNVISTTGQKDNNIVVIKIEGDLP